MGNLALLFRHIDSFKVLVNNQFHTALKVPANEKLTMVEISGKVKISQLRIDNPVSHRFQEHKIERS